MRASHNRIIPVTFFLLITIAASRAHAAGIPTDQIKATVDKAIVVLKDPRLKSETKTRERREQLKPILFARFDFAEMGKRALGSEWRRRTPTEQEEFVRLFTDLLEHAYAQTIESYTDEKIIYVGEKLDGSYADVSSKILTNKGQEYSIDYKAHVVVENISMVNNFRSQFTRVIAHSSYEELIRKLKAKADLVPEKK